MNEKKEGRGASYISDCFRIKIPSQLSPGLPRNRRGWIVAVNETSETKRRARVEDLAERRPVGAGKKEEIEKQEKKMKVKKRARHVRKRAGKGKEPRGNRRELAGTCIKGSYRDKGINTSTKCGEFDGRSSSKSYLFEVSIPSPLSLLLSCSHAASTSPFTPFSRYRSPGSRSLPIPTCPPLSTAAVGSSRYSIPVARRRFGSAIPPRQTRLGLDIA